ncbi:MAG: ABC transporter ATP-binding protein [Myxococcales bacterium]|nr:ABC transporter ATP-binding protein [Myxococcales bacterium]
MSTAPLLTCRNLVKRFGDVAAVQDVSFSVDSGEIFGLLGPNGAGKTTCLRMLATLLKPDQGEIQVCGYDVSRQTEAVRRVLGYQTGDTRLYERLTPVEFLRYFGDLHGMERGHMEERIEELVAMLGIEDYRAQLCGSLSTGQQQRVGIARALLHDPRVLILDEPTNGLDIISSQFLVEFLQRERERGKAILVSTHIMGEAELLCDRLGIIHQGRLLWCDRLSRLLEDTGEPTLTRGFLQIIHRGDDDTARPEPAS